jgi:hypothetical protein
MEDIHQHNPYRLYLGNNLTGLNRERAIELQTNRTYVCLLSGADIIINAVYCILGYYQLIFSVILAVVGYIGAISYNNYMVGSYLINIIFIVFLKAFLLSIIVRKVGSNESIKYIKGNETGTLDSESVTLACFSSLVAQILIFHYVMTFYIMIFNSRRVRSLGY